MQLEHFSVQDGILILVKVFKTSMKNANYSPQIRSHSGLCDLQCTRQCLQRRRNYFPGNLSNGK